MLRRIILTAASVVALSAAANAADMYQGPAPATKTLLMSASTRSGLYFGANGGSINDTSSDSTSNGFGGGQLGYNIQRGNIVFGVETDIEAVSDSQRLFWYRARPRRLCFRSRLGLRHGRLRLWRM